MEIRSWCEGLFTAMKWNRALGTVPRKRGGRRLHWTRCERLETRLLLTAVDDSFTAIHDHQISGNVLGNDDDTGVEGGLSAGLVSGVSHGSLDLNSNGSFTYTPDVGFVGCDSFSYRASSESPYDDVASVAFCITNAIPVAESLSLSVVRGSSVSANLLARATDADLDQLVFVDLIPSLGFVGDMSCDSSGNFTYWDNGSTAGGGLFSFVISDGVDTCNGTVTVGEVTPPSLSFGINYHEGRSVTLSGTVSDSEPGGLTVTFSGVVSGSATTGADGSFSLTADATGLGNVFASVTNALGATSDTASAEVTSLAPSVSVSVIRGSGSLWTISGSANDESMSDLVVMISGLGVSTPLTLSTNGAFSINVELDANSCGAITATATDCWGLYSTATSFVDGEGGESRASESEGGESEGEGGEGESGEGELS